MIQVVIGNTNGDEFTIDDVVKEVAEGDVYQLFNGDGISVFLISVSNIAYRYNLRNGEAVGVQKKGGL